MKAKEVKKTPFLTLNPLNSEIKSFSEKQSCSNNGPYCPLNSYKKLGRSLEPFWSKVQRSKNKATSFGHLIPYNPRLRTVTSPKGTRPELLNLPIEKSE